jgi:hypothetical protein
VKAAQALAGTPEWLARFDITPTEYHSPRWALIGHDGGHEYVTSDKACGVTVGAVPDPARLAFFWPCQQAWKDNPEDYKGLVYIDLTDAERRLAQGADEVALAVRIWTEAWLARMSKQTSATALADDYRFRATQESDMTEHADYTALADEYEQHAAAEAARPAPPPKRQTEFDDDDLDEMVIAPTPWIVEGIVAPGLTLLAAPPKMGKSYFVLQMAQCVAAGVPFLGRQTRKVKVSYFDLEEWEGLLKPRRDKIRKGNGIVKGQGTVRYVLELTGGGTTVLEDMQRHINGGAELLILDLLARARDELGEDAKKNAYARDYAALKQFADFILQRNPRVALVIVHHTNKGTHAEVQNRISGTQGLAGATHCNIVMSSVDLRALDDDAKAHAKNYRELFIVGKEVEQLDLMIKKMDNGGGWEVTDATITDVRTTSKAAHILQILLCANGNVMSATDIASETQGPGNDQTMPPKNEVRNVREILMRMQKRGEVESVRGPQGGYFIRPTI